MYKQNVSVLINKVQVGTECCDVYAGDVSNFSLIGRLTQTARTPSPSLNVSLTSPTSSSMSPCRLAHEIWLVVYIKSIRPIKMLGASRKLNTVFTFLHIEISQILTEHNQEISLLYTLRCVNTIYRCIVNNFTNFLF